MEKKLSGLVLLFVLLVAYEFTVMQIEARTCLAKSKKYRGRCYLRSQMRNCKTICKIKEGFMGGLCKRGICMCSGKCGTNLPYNPPSISPPSEGGDGSSPGGDGGNNPGVGDGSNPGGGVGNNPDGGDDNNPGGGPSTNPGSGVGNNTDVGPGTSPGGGDGNNPDGGVGNNPGGGQGGTGARTCRSKSKKYRGKCYSYSHSRNCKTICKIKEGFIGGVCKRGRCMCTAKCGTHSLPYNVFSVSQSFEVEGESKNADVVVEKF